MFGNVRAKMNVIDNHTHEGIVIIKHVSACDKLRFGEIKKMDNLS